MPQPKQWDNVLAEFSKQHIKVANDIKAANAMAKKQGSTGEDEAVAIASLAVARGQGKLLPALQFQWRHGKLPPALLLQMM